MPIDDARLRQLIGCAAEANLEAEISALVARAGAAPPAPPTPPAAVQPAPTASAGTPSPSPTGTTATPPPAVAPGSATATLPAQPGTQAQPAAGLPAGPAPAAPVAPAGVTAPATAPAVPALPGGMVVISQGVLEQLQRDAAAGAAAAATLQEADNERVLTAALSEGRIAPADLADRPGPNGTTVAGLRSAIRTNPQAVRTMLAALTPRFATSAIGADTGVEVEPTGSPADEAAWAAFEAHLGANFGVAPPAAAGQPATQPGGVA